MQLSDYRADPQGAPLATPSGRIELYSPTIAGFGYDDCPPDPSWLEPSEWLGSAEPDELHLVTNQPAKQLHSQLFQANHTSGPAEVRISPADAQARKLVDGEDVRLWNKRGACMGRALVDKSLRPGALVMPTGAWFAISMDGLEMNGNPNLLTHDRRTSRLGQAVRL
ncbi:MAG: molybdopterin dinucleotide binding domain-containing protein [Breoghania sp.]|nr:molybdopterin dinucleotide binding domain-containing protein [Breoghania sp.]MDJ0933024.1 molybdopterin dinucleotide binding domain-containing protein [Breoghania sp.]